MRGPLLARQSGRSEDRQAICPGANHSWDVGPAVAVRRFVADTKSRTGITVPERKTCANAPTVGVRASATRRRGCQPCCTVEDRLHIPLLMHIQRTMLYERRRTLSGSPLRHNNHTLADKDTSGALTTLIRRVKTPLTTQLFDKRRHRLAVTVPS